MSMSRLVPYLTKAQVLEAHDAPGNEWRLMPHVEEPVRKSPDTQVFPVSLYRVQADEDFVRCVIVVDNGGTTGTLGVPVVMFNGLPSFVHH